MSTNGLVVHGIWFQVVFVLHLRSGEDVFLDDYRLCDLENSLQVPIDIVKSSGWDFVEAIMGEKIYE